MPLTGQGLIARVSGRTVDSPDAPEVADTLARRRIIRFVAIGIAAYLVAMVWTLPASVLLNNRPWRTGVAGTIWNGEVGVAGGSVFEWHWAPLRSLTSLGFAADWHATGPDTDLGGLLLARPGRVVLDKVSGSADASLLRAVQPELPFACNMVMQVDVPRMALGGDASMMTGQVKTDAGTCFAEPGGAATPVAPLLLRAEHIGEKTILRLTPFAQRRRVLVDMTLGERGALRVEMTPEGARELPFAGIPGGVSFETTL